jgi:hypothetical protein
MEAALCPVARSHKSECVRGKILESLALGSFSCGQVCILLLICHTCILLLIWCVRGKILESLTLGSFSCGQVCILLLICHTCILLLMWHTCILLICGGFSCGQDPADASVLLGVVQEAMRYVSSSSYAIHVSSSSYASVLLGVVQEAMRYFYIYTFIGYIYMYIYGGGTLSYEVIYTYIYMYIYIERTYI